MDRHTSFHRPRRGWATGLSGALLVGLLSSLGCLTPPGLPRAQNEDETEHERYGVVTVGDKTAVGNVQPVALSGVGLVEGLEGTGGESPADGFRAMLEESLQKRGERHPKALLRDPNNAMVLVSAVIPPGAHKGDLLDVEVTLPRGSRATSLRGGKLRLCDLCDYDFAQRLSPGYAGSAELLKGHTLAKAQGSVLVGLGSGDDDGRLRQGRIWNGARCLRDQPLSLVMNSDQQFGRMTALIADRVNAVFQPGAPTAGQAAIATAYNNLAVYIQVPAQYKLNVPRYLRVVRLVPLQGEGDTPADKSKTPRRPYRQIAGEDLLDPARTVTAALRLEALGPGSERFLKRGLESKHPLVRFCSAESLLYLGSPAGAEEVAKAVLQQPLLRSYGLTALASLDEAVCQLKLADVLVQARDDETRYGAFRALHTLDDNNPAIPGEKLGDSFWLHHAAPNTPPLVHCTTVRRAEIVLFGEEPFLRSPFGFVAGEFTLTATPGDARCVISRVPLHGSPTRKLCSLRLDEVLRTMAEMGGQYPEAVALLQQADKSEALSCKVAFDALPQATDVHDLVKAGKQALGADNELLPPGQDLGATPTLYEGK